MLTESELSEYASVAESFVSQLRSQLNELGVIRRVAHRYPFDHLCLELMNKVFSLDDACMSLIRSGWSAEAYGLSRSIVECALTLRYITANRNDMVQRTMKFANASKADRRLWLHFAQIGAASESERQYIDELAAARDLFPDTKSAFKHWSGESSFVKTASELVHPLDPESADSHYKSLRRASDYFYTSHFVHCSQTALDYSAVLDGDTFSFRTESAENDRFIAERCITLLISYSKQVAAYALFGMDVLVPASFTVFTDFTFDESVGRFKPKAWYASAGSIAKESIL